MPADRRSGSPPLFSSVASGGRTVVIARPCFATSSICLATTLGRNCSTAPRRLPTSAVGRRSLVAGSDVRARRPRLGPRVLQPSWIRVPNQCPNVPKRCRSDKRSDAGKRRSRATSRPPNIARHSLKGLEVPSSNRGAPRLKEPAAISFPGWERPSPRVGVVSAWSAPRPRARDAA